MYQPDQPDPIAEEWRQRSQMGRWLGFGLLGLAVVLGAIWALVELGSSSSTDEIRLNWTQTVDASGRGLVAVDLGEARAGTKLSVLRDVDVHPQTGIAAVDRTELDTVEPVASETTDDRFAVVPFELNAEALDDGLARLFLRVDVGGEQQFLGFSTRVEDRPLDVPTIRDVGDIIEAAKTFDSFAAVDPFDVAVVPLNSPWFRRSRENEVALLVAEADGTLVPAEVRVAAEYSQFHPKEMRANACGIATGTMATGIRVLNREIDAKLTVDAPDGRRARGNFGSRVHMRWKFPALWSTPSADGSRVVVYLGDRFADQEEPILLVLEAGGRVFDSQVWTPAESEPGVPTIELQLPEDLEKRPRLRLVNQELDPYILPLRTERLHETSAPDSCRGDLERVASQLALIAACESDSRRLDVQCGGGFQSPTYAAWLTERAAAKSTLGLIGLGLLVLALLVVATAGLYFVWRDWVSAEDGGWPETILATGAAVAVGVGTAVTGEWVIVVLTVPGVLVLLFALGQEFLRDPDSFIIGWFGCVVALAGLLGVGWVVWGFASPVLFGVVLWTTMGVAGVALVGTVLGARVLLANSRRLAGWAIMWVPAVVVLVAVRLLVG